MHQRINLLARIIVIFGYVITILLQSTMSIFSQFGIWYSSCLDTHPLLTKATTTAAIGLLGDATAQFHEIGRLKKYNTRRGIANVANNLFLTAPIYHYGYEWLESLIPIYDADESLSSSVVGNSLAAMVQVLFDCIIFDAIFVVLMVLSSSMIEGCNNNTNARTVSTAHHVSSIQTNLMPAINASWKINIFMMPVEFLLFRYFPLRLRVLGMNVIDLVWEAVMSFVIHDERNQEVATISIASISGSSEENQKMISASGETTSSLSLTPASTPWSSPSSGGSSADDVIRDPMMLPPLMPSSTLACGRAKHKQS